MKKVFIACLFIMMLSLTGCGGPAVAGKYKCSSYYDESEKTILELDLNKNKTFSYRAAGGEVKGKYSYQLEDKGYKDTRFYMITLNLEEANFDGEDQELSKSIDFEFALEKDGSKKEGIIIFTNTYNMYYCKNY